MIPAETPGLTLPTVPQASPTPNVGPPDPLLAPFPAPTNHAEPRALSLQDALAIALQNSPDLLASRDQIRIAQYQVRAQYVPFNPTFNLSAQGNPYQVLIPNVGQVTTIYTFQGTVQQLVYDFGRVHFSALAARLSEKQTRQNYRTTLEKLLQSVETTYYTVALAEVNVDIARQRVGERRMSLKVANDLYKAGFVAQYDVLQYQTQLGQALQDLLTSQGAAEKARESLVIALGLAPGTPIRLTPQPEPDAPPGDGQAGLAQALVRRPEVAALTWAIRSAEVQIRAAARLSSPSLYMTGQYTGTSSPFGRQFGTFTYSSFVPGLTLTIPVLDGRYAHWQRMQVEATLSQTQHQLASMRRSVEQDVIQAFTDMETYWQQISIARATAAQAKEAYGIAMVRYREGFSNSIELLNAQDAFVQANQLLATALYNYRVAQVNWRRAISAEYPLTLPASVKVEWEQPLPLLTPPTLPATESTISIPTAAPVETRSARPQGPAPSSPQTPTGPSTQTPATPSPQGVPR